MPDLLPDPGEAFRLWARSRPAITAIFGSRISLVVSSSEPTLRYAQSGGGAGWGEGTPLLQLESWGRGNQLDDGTAGLGARTVAAEIEAMRGVWGDAWVAGATVEGFPYDSPDTTTERPRQILTARLFIYPKEQGA